MRAPIARAASTTYFRSADPSSSGGVPTALNRIVALRTAWSTSVVNCRRPAAALPYLVLDIIGACDNGDGYTALCNPCALKGFSSWPLNLFAVQGRGQ